MSAAELDRLGGKLDLSDVQRLAHWAASKGPHRLHDDMASEAALRVLEAVHSGAESGFGQIAYRGASKVMREATFQAGGRQARNALEGDCRPVILAEPSDLTLLSDTGSVADVVVERLDGAGPRCQRRDVLGPTLDRLVDVLADRGLDATRVSDALCVLADRVGRGVGAGRGPSGGLGRSRVFDVPVTEMAESSGLDTLQCAALKVLVLGERPRKGTIRGDADGLLSRVRRGEEPWNDPRALRLIDQVVDPTVRLARPWSGRAAVADLAPNTAA